MAGIAEALQRAAKTANPTAAAPKVTVADTSSLTANSSSGKEGGDA